MTAARIRIAGLGLLLGLGLTSAPVRADDPFDASELRIAFCAGMFSEVNENDARASVKAWANSVARERDVNVRVEAQIYASVDAMAQAIRQSRVDAAGLSTAEYFALEPCARWGPLFAATTGDDISDSYVLLVHRDGGISRLQDLRGRQLVIYKAPRTELAGHWLGGLLREARLPPAAKFFGEHSNVAKMSQAVLPVFFHQADACLVTQRGFETLAELNPQIGKDLVALATSPAVITALFCFRTDYDSSARDGLIEGVRGLHLTAAGRQVLTVFQSGRLVEIPASALAAARQVYDSDRTPAGARGQLAADDEPAPRHVLRKRSP